MGIQTQKGSSLVEVMVALFVLAIGLLGVLAMQSKSMQYNQSAYVYSQAVYLANDMAERIRNNINNPASYIGTPSDTVPGTICSDNPCDAAALALWDKYIWNKNVKKSLPLGQGNIETVAAAGVVPAHLRVTVTFDDSRSEGKIPGEAGYAGTKTYTLVVEI
jgi:type IV pilus assembly protein PilV